MGKNWAKQLSVVAVGALALTMGLPMVTAGAAETVRFTVGVTQDIDSLNVTVGYLVIDYEIWNLTLPTLTSRASKDFATQAALADSWTSSEDGLTWTYKLRDGALWSDGEPMTSADLVYTIERAVAESWMNHTSSVGNLTATAPDATTVVVTSAVPDPKLPNLDFYIVPKHVYEKISAEDLPNYLAGDNVSGGPFTIVERKEGEFVRLARNDNWYGKKPALEEVVFRLFETPEAQFNAMKAGDIDAIDDVPTNIFAKIIAGEEPGIEAVGGNQGSFSELAMNASCATGIGNGHVALKDKLVRQAINWAIDRDLLVDKLLGGNGIPGVTMVASADPALDLQIADADKFSYNPEKAMALLDQAGWKDSNGDGVRDKGGVELKLRYFDRSTGTATASTPFITGWLKDIGIATEVQTYDESTLTAYQSKGEFDLYTWGWTPFIDPDPMLSYFTTAQVPTDPDVGGYNDGNWCNGEYDALYAKQNVEIDPVKRAAIVQQMLKVFYFDGPYAVLYKYDDLQAIRSDRWQGWTRQPENTGPVFFTSSSEVYQYITPKTGGGDSGGSSSTLLIVIGAVVVVALVGIGFNARKKKSADDRE